MTGEHEQLSFTSCIHCPTCPGYEYCGESGTSHACPVEYGPAGTEAHKILHPSRPDLGVRLADCMGLDFNVVSRPGDLPELPRYIPCVSPRGFIRGALSFPAVAVPLKEVVSPRAQSTQRGWNLRHRLGITPETKLILIGFGKDQLLESIWARRYSTTREIGTMHLDLVTAFGFSVYEDDTRLEHMYSMKRSLVTYQLLQSHDVPAVPHICWFNRIDLDRWCEWLDNNPSVSMVAIDLQSCDRSCDWDFALTGLEYLRANAPSALSYLFYGVAHPIRIAALVELIPRLHLSSQYPLMMAVQGHETEYVDGDRVKRRSDRSRRRIFLEEVQNMRDLVDSQRYPSSLVREDWTITLTGEARI